MAPVLAALSDFGATKEKGIVQRNELYRLRPYFFMR